MTRILGAILAGGRSSRFGSDKAEAMLHGRRLIDWAWDCLRPNVDTIILCGRPGGIADRPHPDLGPLGGINAALHHARAHGFDAVISMPCDVPLLPPETIEQLARASTQHFIADLPVIGRWHPDYADLLDTHLQGGDRSVRRWASRIGSVPIDLATDIDNVNSPDDLARMADRPR